MDRQVQATANSRGISTIGLLTCIFAAAKVFGFSSMPWLWVFSPIWISVLATIAFLLLFFDGALLYDMWQDHKRAKRREAAREHQQAIRYPRKLNG